MMILAHACVCRKCALLALMVVRKHAGCARMLCTLRTPPHLKVLSTISEVVSSMEGTMCWIAALFTCKAMAIAGSG